MTPYRYRGGTALVTGAASGIGAALAVDLASRGSDLVLLDRDEEGLTRIAALARRQPVAVETVVADLADRAGTREIGARLARDYPEVTLLLNVAGVALGGRFEDVTLDEFEWLLDIDLHAPIALTAALLPVLLTHPGSHLANVSSIFGIVAPPGQAAYATAKFGLRGFTEALAAELAGRVGVTVVHPGGIRTRIAESARLAARLDPAEAERGRRAIARVLRIPPRVAAERILEGVERRRPRVLIGASAVLPDLAVRIAPVTTQRLFARGVRRAGAPGL
ncbi:SDR family NAD(P)-dependent oxidoreductase [Amnibacterium sp. CER49]|uniref:SDR family NAD(P)-dependent oxidoreductase n=1 Tax=Amnibacterium sp. CER49 TaxID=3039161 RepID=UPI002446C0C0|nr:SDR family NAD(P)-dependent oxidoreductase [Amnibacterium sp. CER49]MDH2443718.1 SDR family NAD(P)-dependent oxidoreductase [Amnibacterium sp. CER49]